MTANIRFCAYFLAGIVSSAHAADRFVPAEPSTPTPEFGLTIRSTPHRTPVEERAGFHVPEGFAVDLIASEPEIAKPLNLAFDAKGRLWVTQTRHYPFPVKEGEPATDSIVVLEDSDRDGDFETKRLFASDLNIPIGILPVDDGVIVFSIPNLWHLRDTDGDGVCDQRKVLYGPFDTSRDTHGMVNSLRDGGDGWIYACHGFNNQSNVAGRDGHRVSMQSGNIFRFRPDGSRIELYSQGQVNPFGMTQDRFGNWFSADCHSKPITQLLQGGCNPSFGRPDDGLGFVPSMMDHLHGSTAIAGLAHTKDSKFPIEMTDQFLSGNVMTCRINRNQISYQGATARATELPDLLTSDDSWFRPVDLVFGPDGHLYIADFYNKVIGHYEVPLDHPDRDRNSGRIWRVRWTGAIPDARAVSQSHPGGSSKTRWSDLGRLELTKTTDAMRWLASVQQLSSQDASVEGLRALLQSAVQLSQLPDPILQQTHAIALRRVIIALADSDPAAVESLFAEQSRISQGLQAPIQRALMRVLPACRTTRCTGWAIDLLERGIANDKERSNEDEQSIRLTVDPLADVVDDSNMDRYLGVLRHMESSSKPHAFAERLVGIGARQQQSRGNLSRKLIEAGHVAMEELAQELNRTHASASRTAPIREWVALSKDKDDRRTWGVEVRQVKVMSPAGGETLESLPLFSSFVLGESYVGSWATEPFTPGGPIEFCLAGHNGLPSKPDLQKNYVRLLAREPATNTYQEVARAYPPRSDVATAVRWGTELFEGKSVVLEVVDGDNGGSYAWIAIGNFSDPTLQLRNDQSELKVLRTMFNLFGVPAESMAVSQFIASEGLSEYARFVILRPMLLQSSPIEAELTDLAAESQCWDIVHRIAIPKSPQDAAAVRQWASDWEEQAVVLLKRMSASGQTRLVRRLSRYRDAAVRFTTWTKQGALSVDALGTLPESWWGGLREEEQEGLASFRASLAARVDKSKLIESKLAEIRDEVPNREVGMRVFMDKCSQCHKLGTLGNVVGPQLEGIGNRGLERLCEDILWPDRNVDEAFRVTLLQMEDGVTHTGLITDRNDETITLVDPLGKKLAIPASEVEQEKRSELSLMPSNMEQTMTTQELASLLSFLQTAAGKQ
ncbi:PVC-type heme-binding CxxCH protein [Pirellulaceae bacterium SH467]